MEIHLDWANPEMVSYQRASNLNPGRGNPCTEDIKPEVETNRRRWPLVILQMEEGHQGTHRQDAESSPRDRAEGSLPLR